MLQDVAAASEAGLRALGFRVGERAGDTWALVLPNSRPAVRTLRGDRGRITLSEARKRGDLVGAQRVLLVAPSASPGVLDAARLGRWDLLLWEAPLALINGVPYEAIGSGGPSDAPRRRDRTGSPAPVTQPAPLPAGLLERLPAGGAIGEGGTAGAAGAIGAIGGASVTTPSIGSEASTGATPHRGISPGVAPAGSAGFGATSLPDVVPSRPGAGAATSGTPGPTADPGGTGADSGSGSGAGPGTDPRGSGAGSGARATAAWLPDVVPSHPAEGPASVVSAGAGAGGDAPGNARVLRAVVGAADVPAPHTGGRPAWTRWAVARLLLLQGSAPVARLSDVLGVSRQAVSRALTQWGELVHRRSDGAWAPRDADTLRVAWSSAYPGPGGVERGWWHPLPPLGQTRAAALVAQRAGASPVVAGAVAAQVHDPSLEARHVLLLLRTDVDLRAAGFQEVEPERATLSTLVPRDPTVWSTAVPAAVAGQPVVIVDRLIAAHGLPVVPGA